MVELKNAILFLFHLSLSAQEKFDLKFEILILQRNETDLNGRRADLTVVSDVDVLRRRALLTKSVTKSGRRLRKQLRDNRDLHVCHVAWTQARPRPILVQTAWQAEPQQRIQSNPVGYLLAELSDLRSQKT